MMCVNVFYETRNEISIGSDKKWENYSEKTYFGNVKSTDMTLPKWAIFTMGVYREIIFPLSDPAEISFLTA